MYSQRRGISNALWGGALLFIFRGTLAELEDNAYERNFKRKEWTGLMVNKRETVTWQFSRHSHSRTHNLSQARVSTHCGRRISISCQVRREEAEGAAQHPHYDDYVRHRRIRYIRRSEWSGRGTRSGSRKYHRLRQSGNWAVLRLTFDCLTVKENAFSIDY